MEKNIAASEVKYWRRAAQKLNIQFSIIDPLSRIYLFKKGRQERFAYRYIPELNNILTMKIFDDKSVTKKIISKYGVPVAGGVRTDKLAVVLKLVRQKKLKYPLVVKPIDGAQGEAVTAWINDSRLLKQAVQKVWRHNQTKRKKFKKYFLVEEFIVGQDYRILFLDGKILTVLRREPAYVLGDGIHTLKQLINLYNQRPEIGKDKPLCPIVMDDEMIRTLAEQKITFKFVPDKNKKVILRHNANVSTGGRCTECLAELNPRYHKLVETIIAASHLRFGAVDLIAPNISQYKDFAVIEVTDTPGFDMHEAPAAGKPCLVSEYLVRAMFKK